MDMHNLERLKSVILEEARQRAAAVVADAKARAERIVEDARARGAESVEEATARAKRNAAENERRAEIARSLEKRDAVLRAKADLVDKLISEIPDAIRAMSDDSYLGIMRQMLLESSPVGEVDVVVAANDRKRITGAFLQDVEAELRKQGKDVSLKPAGTANSIRGGFLLKTSNIEVDCSLDALVALCEDELAPLVGEALFGGR